MIRYMKENSTPILPDWVSLSVRWVFLMAVSLWLVFGDGVDWAVLTVIILAAAGNIAATVIVAVKRASFAFRVICSVGDLVFAHILFFLTIGTGRDLAWPVFLPLISAALFFQLFGAISCTLANTLLLGALAFPFAPMEDVLLLVGIMLPLNILVGLGLVYLENALGSWGSISQKGTTTI